MPAAEFVHSRHFLSLCSQMCYIFRKNCGLLTTGGSDFHGMYSRTARPLGNSDGPENIPQKMRTYKSRRNTSAG